ncbi:class I SAM-dependent methyltransferase [Aneurinibacillus uraniidurans]|uniref:class I SAM-dependent methyltransferase n=1 Tax=Aneurinibacillus uraniidurans TaxID=2966586 RepID=UPI00234B23FB|nr:class I SAM-dependent methyltransferase [Aneurinibacillus sp. B1]WCN39436.1 class I SAM-dependent methyltransferase [Aneurinibacillus sp. B1]
MKSWKEEQVVQAFMDVRPGIPYGADQMKIMVQLVAELHDKPASILDLGCGDGITGEVLLQLYPEASGDFIDQSEPMLAKAEERLAAYPSIRIIQADLETEKLSDITNRTYDCIVSSYALHHLTHPRKRSIYEEIYQALNPGGVFLNVEHVASRSERMEAIWDRTLVNHIYEHRRTVEPAVTERDVWNAYINRADRFDNILAPAEDQCNWLRECGFADVDIYFKYFELAVFGGRKNGVR